MKTVLFGLLDGLALTVLILALAGWLLVAL